MPNNLNLPLKTRKQVGATITDLIDAAMLNVKGYIAWTEEVERASLGMDAGAAMTDGKEPPFEVTFQPLMPQRLEALTSQMCMTIGKNRPWLLAESDDSADADTKSELVHRLWKDAGFLRSLRNASNICGKTDLAFWRIVPRGDGRIMLSVHHPRDVAVIPALPTGLDDATLIGHRIPQPRRYITVRQNRGDYYKDKAQRAPMDTANGIVNTDGMVDVERERSGVGDGDAGPQPSRDGIVELWDVVVRLDLTDLDGGDDYKGKKERWYRATVCRDDRLLLALEEYNLPTPWYAESRLLGSQSFVPPTSVGRNLLHPQREYSALWSLNRFAIQKAADPTVYGPPLDSKTTVVGGSTYLETDDGASAFFAPPSQARTEQIPIMLRDLRLDADGICRISGNSTGRATPGQTATQAQIVDAGQATGLEEFIDNFTGGFGRLALITEAIIRADYEAVAERFNVVDAPEEPPEDPMANLDPAVVAQIVAMLSGQGGPPGVPAGAAPMLGGGADMGPPAEPIAEEIPEPSGYNEDGRS